MKKVLLVEDDDLIQKSLNLNFIQDFKVYTVDSGDKVLESAKEIKPDVILLDLLIPKKSGIDVLKELKNTKETKDIPVIIFSNSDEDSEMKKCKELGALDYYVKCDTNLDSLKKKLKKLKK